MESEDDSTTDSLEPDSGPSDTATAHGHLRPQLSRAFTALYGSHNRKGLIYGLQVLATLVPGRTISPHPRTLFSIYICARQT